MRVVDCFTRTTRRTERVKKFDICLVKLPSLEEGNLVFGGMHPAIIVSNDRCNKYSPSVTIVPMTSKRKKYLPTHVNLCGFGLRRAGIALCEQVTTIDKTQITKKVGYIHDRGVQNAIHHAIRAQIAM